MGQAQFDLNGDGQVDLNEFRMLMVSSGMYDDPSYP
jgi:hypothetical protein